MKVQIVASMTGTRDGEDWPQPGEFLTVTAAEGADLILAGIARSDAKLETADAPAAPESAVVAKPRPRK
jgi:hypothetical protein